MDKTSKIQTKLLNEIEQERQNIEKKAKFLEKQALRARLRQERRRTLWISISLICLLCAGDLLYFMLQERHKRIETEKQLLKSEKDKSAVAKKLGRMQLELAQSKDKAVLLANGLAQEKRNYQAALAKLTKREARIKELENILAKGERQRGNLVDELEQSLVDELEQSKENYGSLEEELNQVRLKMGKLKGQLVEVKSRVGVELGKIVVKPKKKLNAELLLVDTEFDLVVIDLGEKDGLNAGDEFLIFRKTEEIGRLQIKRVYEVMSIAAILSGSQEFRNVLTFK